MTGVQTCALPILPHTLGNNKPIERKIEAPLRAIRVLVRDQATGAKIATNWNWGQAGKGGCLCHHQGGNHGRQCQPAPPPKGAPSSLALDQKDDAPSGEEALTTLEPVWTLMPRFHSKDTEHNPYANMSTLRAPASRPRNSQHEEKKLSSTTILRPSTDRYLAPEPPRR